MRALKTLMNPRPVTPKVAGSSPVAPANVFKALSIVCHNHPTRGSAKNPTLMRRLGDLLFQIALVGFGAFFALWALWLVSTMMG